MKKLSQSTTDRMLLGVLGGLSAYFGLESKLVRILFILFLILTGLFPGVFLYFIAALILRNDSSITPHASLGDENRDL